MQSIFMKSTIRCYLTCKHCLSYLIAFTRVVGDVTVLVDNTIIIRDCVSPLVQVSMARSYPTAENAIISSYLPLIRFFSGT